jgi:hypothetical protein
VSEAREIEFEDIREGDKIRTVVEYDSGVIRTAEGVVKKSSLTSNFISENSEWIIAKANYGQGSKVTYTLLHRDEPKDHIVGYNDGDGGFKVETFCTLTESKAKKIAEDWTAGGTRGRTYRAVKVEL